MVEIPWVYFLYAFIVLNVLPFAYIVVFDLIPTRKLEKKWADSAALWHGKQQRKAFAEAERECEIAFFGRTL
jgi:hypothetical protein